MLRSFCPFRFGDSQGRLLCRIESQTTERTRVEGEERGRGGGEEEGLPREEQGRARIAFFYNSRLMIAKQSRFIAHRRLLTL